MGFLVGRGTEQGRLRKFLQPGSSKNVMFVSGEVGIGKTRLIEHMMHEVKAPGNPGYTQIDISVEDSQWISFVTGLLRDLLKAVGEGRPPSMATIEELEELIVQRASVEELLLIIDDLITVKPELRKFVSLFAQAKKSRLIIVIEDDPESMPDHVDLLNLTALDTEDVKQLFSGSLEKLIESNNAWQEIEKLNGNSQKLMLLQGFEPQPKNLQELKDRIRSLSDPNINLLEEVAEKYPHFAALGCLRQPIFEEDIFAFLWDRLGHGGSAQYIRVRQDLINRNLLISPDYREHNLRLNGGAHQQLQDLAKNNAWASRLEIAHYLLSVYFRNRFALHGDQASMMYLKNYVYHAVRSNRTINAFIYLFETEVLHTAFRRDLSQQLKPVLTQLEESLESMKASFQDNMEGGGYSAEATSTKLKLAQVKMELGRIQKDLNDPELGLKYLLLARDLISDISGERKDWLSMRINHYLGIVHSVLGQEEDCRKAYTESVMAASIPEPVTALSLGYLAYETKFTNLGLAEKYARDAISLSLQIGDHETEMKNFCSLGQILSFAGRFLESKQAFRSANLVDVENIREQCRVKINSMVTHIGMGNHREARKQLEEAKEQFGKTGDRRRLNIGQAFLGIIEYKENKQKLGFDLVASALESHHQSGARREALYEALTLRYWGVTGEYKNLVAKVLESEGNLKIYEDFWNNHYRFSLLDTRWGVIFDLDGVVADTAPFHLKAVESLLADNGLTLEPGDFDSRIFGRPNRVWMADLYPQLASTSDEFESVADQKEELFRRAIKNSVKGLPGVTEIIRKLTERNIPIAIASSAPMPNIELILNEIGIRDSFTIILDENAVLDGKPNPDIFLAAAEKLELVPERCVVFEDSFSGIDAGINANCNVIGVATTHEAEEISPKVNRVISDFTEIEVEDLENMFLKQCAS